MEGYRKLFVWGVTAGIMTGAFFWTVPKLSPGDVASVLQTFMMMQAATAGAFAGANFGEYWAKAKEVKGSMAITGEK